MKWFKHTTFFIVLHGDGGFSMYINNAKYYDTQHRKSERRKIYYS